jgi:hypothetical protein
MILVCTIVLAWFALSLPLAVLVGKCIRLGMEESADRRRRPSQKQSAAIGSRPAPILR